MKFFHSGLGRLFIWCIIVFPFFVSCKKDQPRKPFEVCTKTFYRLSPTDPIPLDINGTQFIGFAYFPGVGVGTATHMGNITYYFNQLTYAASPGAPPAGSVSAPIIDVLNYPVTGAPLPLIQAGDFDGLASVQSSLNIPKEVYGLIVNAVIVGKGGDAVFTSAITGSGSTFPITAMRIGFNGKALITGGRGKFKKAVGEIDYEGSFDVNNANDAEYNADGWISY